MKKYPFVKQPYVKDCGVCCLSMIIKYYKGNVPLSRLRTMTYTTSEGVTAFHLIDAANKLGFISNGIKCNIEDLENFCPSIAHVTIDNIFNHFIVIYEVDTFLEEITVGDPAKGITTISFEEFKSIFNNLLITFKLKEQPPIYKNHSILNIINSWIMPYKKSVVTILVISILIIFLSLISSFYYQYLIDYMDKKYLICILFLLIFLAKSLLNFIKNNLFIYFANKIDKDMTCDTFSKIINLPYLSFCNKIKGEYITRMNDLNNIRSFIVSSFTTVFVDIIVSIFSLIILFIINDFLTYIVLLMVFVFIFIIYFFKNNLLYLINEIKTKNDITSSIMVEGINGYETIKGINIEKYVTDDFKYNYESFLEKSVSYQKLVNKQQFIKESFYSIFYIIIMFFGIYNVSINNMSIGSLITYNTLLTLFLNPINEIFDLNYSFKEAYMSLKRIIELDEEQRVKSGVKKLISKSIYFIHTRYTHMDKVKILNDISFNIAEGEKVVILGSSGSGKSTILKLLAKKYPIEDKQIYIGSIDINKCSINDFKLNLSYVSQNETLFTKSIYENITLGKKVPNEILQSVINICCLDEILLKKHMNLFSLLEDNGSNLSGGERQVIILCRTLLFDTKIILIDEGLNQLDVLLERRILYNLFSFYKDKTFIVVSHRSDNIDLFNHLLQIDKGYVVKDINKEEVYAT